MDKYEQYKQSIKLPPHEGGDDDYRETLSNALKKYFELMDDMDRPANWDALKQKKGMNIDKINNIALNSYKGLTSTAYAQLSYMFGKQINEDLICYTCIFHTHFCLVNK